MSNTLTAANRSAWQWTSAAALLLFLVVAGLLWETSAGFVKVWLGSETYNHGFVILPIMLWLIWQKRAELALVAPQPILWPLLLVAGFTALWLLGQLIGLLFFSQVAMVGVLISGAVGLLGWRIATFLAFPLLFMMFAVPVGEELVPPMMEFTATFTVEALRLTGIPVYREGMWFMLPTGSWSVIAACSGTRYIIASVTLGFLFAYISYHTLWKRLLFIAFSAVLPIIANGIRAYMIVMIGHLSDMQLAVGVDHLIVGWVWFGLIMLIMFWVGGIWQEEHPPLQVHEGARFWGAADRVTSGVLVLGVALILALGLVFSQRGANDAPSKPLITPQLENRQAIPWYGHLAPEHLPTDYKIRQSYRGQNDIVSVLVALYPQQQQGQEAVAGRNIVVSYSNSVQQLKINSPQTVELGDRAFAVNEGVMTHKLGTFSVERMLVWQWYRVGDAEYGNRYRAKLGEASARVINGRSDGAWILMATPIPGNDEAAARATLQRFMREHYASFVAAMDDVVSAEP